jgi:hypothetical protein
MNLRPLLPLALALVAASCRDEPPRIPRIQEALPHMPLPPNPGFVSKYGSADALQIVVRTPLTPQQALAFYRDTLGKAPWRLISDQAIPDSGWALYAERDGPPLWVTIRPEEGSTGSVVSLSGAVVKKPEAAAADTGKPKAPADTSKPKPRAPADTGKRKAATPR